MLKTLARTTPLVKAVLLTKVFAVCVLVDSRVRLVMKVKRNAHQHSIVKCTILTDPISCVTFFGEWDIVVQKLGLCLIVHCCTININ